MSAAPKLQSTGEYKNLLPKTIVVLNEKEKPLIEEIYARLADESEEVVSEISAKLLQLQNLSEAMSEYPSINQSSVFAGEMRSEQTLLEKMCKMSPDISLLNFPTKAILGKSFVVAKFHFFGAVLKIAENYLLPTDLTEKLRNLIRNVMFTIMAEDVYIAILENTEANKDIKLLISKNLANLWEYRLDSNIEQFANVLSKVWRARNKIAPVFGTMLGTSELFLLSMALDESWQKFMIAKMHIPDIGMALEEFLFGISYENICFLRKELRRKGIHSIGRYEVSRLLGKKQEFEERDPRIFYASYSQRRNNAIARKRLNIDGPKNTLEDHYIKFVCERMLEKNKLEEN
ncbi:MAG: hypothetical protein CR988_01320 [Treponema sp.]|nr:MAG: hypothetical protein CR988_01320 [Treponema sp.]